MDRNNDVALMHNLYYNYENLGGLTGQWEPENTDDDSNASSSSPSPCDFKKPRSDSSSSSRSRSSNKKDSNENFTNGRTSICDNPESPTFPRFPDLVEDLVGSPLKIPSSVMKSTDETLETTEASEEVKRRVEENDEEEKKKEVEESSTGNGEGVRWVFNTPYFYPNGTGKTFTRSIDVLFLINHICCVCRASFTDDAFENVQNISGLENKYMPFFENLLI